MQFYENHSHSSISAPSLLSIYLLIFICLSIDTKKFLTVMMIISSWWDYIFLFYCLSFLIMIMHCFNKNNKALLVWKIFKRSPKWEKQRVYSKLQIARMSASIYLCFGRGLEADRRMVKLYSGKKRSPRCPPIGSFTHGKVGGC